MIRRVGFAIAAVLMVLVVAAGCGGGDDTSSDATASSGSTDAASTEAGGGEANSSGADVKAAEDAVTAAEAEYTKFEAPGPAFDAKKASGKMIWFEQYDASSPTTAIWRENLNEAVKPYGVEVTNFDGQGEVSVQSQGIKQAIAQGAGVIILSGVDPESISADISKAQAAGIPVIMGSNGKVGKPTIPGVEAAVTINHETVGQLLADWAVDSKGEDANVYAITHSAILGAAVITDALEAQLAQLCGECKFTLNDLSFAKINTLPNVTSTAITSDPGITQISPVYDFETLSIVPGIKQAGTAGKEVTAASFNALPEVLKAMQEGEPISADVGAPNAYVGYAYADQAMRILAGLEPVADEKIPIRLFTAENVEGLDPEGGDEELYGPVDYQKEFETLWSGAGA